MAVRRGHTEWSPRPQAIPDGTFGVDPTGCRSRVPARGHTCPVISPDPPMHSQNTHRRCCSERTSARRMAVLRPLAVGFLASAFLAACGTNGSPEASPPPADQSEAVGVADTAASGVVRPGAPGEPSRAWTEADRGGPLPHTEADVAFMQGMILHHAQALEMSALAPTRSQHPRILTLARRIEVSQDDEIALMVRWLEARGEEVPEVHVHDWDAEPEGPGHGDHGDHAEHAHHDHAGHGMEHDHGEMHGMLTPEQMAELAGASGTEFDRLFLEYMIMHHDGAITMVYELARSPGAAQDSEIYGFASHVESDQAAEIRRMEDLLASLR
ncbi:MAG: DUF305 domain-containing protein [Gemmatimonadales bacterium]|nr:MAG: DUF305 domain-containing protein [Gemmatimonadales bacterium]